MKHKQIMTFVLCGALLIALSACNHTEIDEGNADMSTVTNIFETIPAIASANTEPNTLPEDTQSDTIPIPTKPTQNLEGGMGIANGTYQDADGVYLTYDGNEMHLFLRFTFSGYSQIGAGIHLYVDGKPQPYYTATDADYSYMHTFYPPNGKEYIAELIFTPVAGEKGDTLEFGFFVVTYPDYFLDDEWGGPAQTDNNCMGLTFRVKYLESPPAVDVVQAQDRVVQLSLEHIDLTSAQSQVVSSQNEVDYSFYVNGKSDFGYFWNVEAEDTVNIRFELMGSSNAQFGLVVYFNHVPVSTSSADVMYVSTQNGKMAVLEAEIDLSGFDGEGVLYAVVVPRNYQIDHLGNSCMLTATGTFYFSSASSYDSLKAQNE